MQMENSKFQQMIDDFTLDSDAIKEIAASFRYDIEHGVRETGESSLRMLKSYIGLPTGKEQGEYLALDFGGTNLRVVLIRLEGDGKFEVLKKWLNRSLNRVNTILSVLMPMLTNCLISLPTWWKKLSTATATKISFGPYVLVPVLSDKYLQCPPYYLDEGICH